jgi:hypothetical protein
VVRGFPAFDSTTCANFSSSHLSIVSAPPGIIRGRAHIRVSESAQTCHLLFSAILIEILLFDLAPNIRIVAKFALCTLFALPRFKEHTEHCLWINTERHFLGLHRPKQRCFLLCTLLLLCFLLRPQRLLLLLLYRFTRLAGHCGLRLELCDLLFDFGRFVFLQRTRSEFQAVGSSGEGLWCVHFSGQRSRRCIKPSLVSVGQRCEHGRGGVTLSSLIFEEPGAFCFFGGIPTSFFPCEHGYWCGCGLTCESEID